MKKYILPFLCINTLLFADQQTEFKLRDIATPSVWSLILQVPWICIKNRNANAIKALWFMAKHRHIKCWHGDNDLHDGNLTIHGPDSIFLYAAIKYPALQSLLPDIFMKFTNSMTINENKLAQFLKAKKEGTGVLTYGDDIDVPLRLKALLEKKNWPDKDIDDFLSDLIIKEHNLPDVITCLSEYPTQNTEFELMLDKKVKPEKYIPTGYRWKFEPAQK